MFERLEDRLLFAGQVFTANLLTDRDQALTEIQGRTSNLSLREAIKLAQVDAGRDTVRLLAAQTYTVASTIIGFDFEHGVTFQVTGDLNISTPVTIEGNGATVDLNQQDRSFNTTVNGVGGDPELVISNLTIANGKGSFAGGALQIHGNGEVILQNVSFVNNQVVGTPGVTDGDENGTSGGLAYGGAVYVNKFNAHVSFSNCTFSGNSVTGGRGGDGDDSNDSGGFGGFALGGAVNINAGNVSFQDTNFTNNRATGGQTGYTESGLAGNNQSFDYGVSRGGAVFVRGGGQVSFTGGRLASNTAQGRSGRNDFDDDNGENGGLAEGGAIYVDNGNGTVTLSGVTLEQNQARGGAGGDADNAGDQGGKGGHGLGGALFLAAGNLTLANSILRQNSTAGGSTGYTESGVKVGNAQANSAVFYTNDFQPYGSSMGGAAYLAGAGTVLIHQSTLSNNTAQGRTGRNDFYDNNGEDAGKALGGAMVISMVGGSVEIGGGTQLRDNLARGAAGGNGDSGSNDLAGKGGDAQGGAVYMDRGNLAVKLSQWSGNRVEGGQSGQANGGVARASTAGLPPPTPQRDLTRRSFAEGGAINVQAGTVGFEQAEMRNNQALGAAGRDIQEQEDGENGGNGSGGAVYLYQPTAPVTFTSSLLAFAARGGAGGKGEEDNDHGGIGGAGQGGALFSWVGVTLNNSILEGNLARGGDGGQTLDGGYGSGGAGGAVHAIGGTFTGSATSFHDNTAQGGEGTFSFENRSGDGGAARGGAIYAVNTTVQISGPNSLSTTVKSNRALGGNAGQLLADSQVDDATAGNGGTALGGAVYQGNRSLEVQYLAMSGNVASGGQGSRGLLTSGALKPPGGNSGDGEGGAIWNHGNLTIAHTDISNNAAVGVGIGDLSTRSGGPGGVGDDDNGLAGGNGGAARGGGVFTTGADLAITAGTFKNNSALGGSGGQGGVYTANGGAGGRGGDAFGGGLMAIVGNSARFDDSLFVGNMVAAGPGGVGGAGAIGSSSGFNGGNGGRGGDAGGGAVYVVGNGRPTSITASTFEVNRVAAGDGGAGGEGGKGQGDYWQDRGGNAGDGGDGGNVSGGGLYFVNSAVTMSESTVGYNVVSAGWGGRGANGGQGVGGGDGGDAGIARGGGIALAGGGLTITKSTVFGNLALSGYGGHGGDGGDGKLYGGDGGNAGNGGQSLGGGIWAGPNLAVDLAACTVSNNGVEAGGAGLKGIRGQSEDGLSSFPTPHGYRPAGSVHALGSMSIFAAAGNPHINVGDDLDLVQFGRPIQVGSNGELGFNAEVAGGFGSALVVAMPATIGAAAAAIATSSIAVIGLTSTIVAGLGVFGVIALVGTFAATVAIQSFIAGNGDPISGLQQVVESWEISPEDAEYSLYSLFVGVEDEDEPEDPYDGFDGQDGGGSVAAGCNIWVDPAGTLAIERTIVADGKTISRSVARTTELPVEREIGIVIGPQRTTTWGYSETVSIVVVHPPIVADQFQSRGHNFVDMGQFEEPIPGTPFKALVDLQFLPTDLHGSYVSPLQLRSVGYLADNGGATPTLELRPDSPARAAFTSAGSDTAQNGFEWNGMFEIGAWGGGANQAPTVEAAAYHTNSGVPIQVPFTDLIAAGEDTDPLTVSGAPQPTASASFTPPQVSPTWNAVPGNRLTAEAQPAETVETRTFSYTPPAEFAGVKQFSFQLSDGFSAAAGNFTIAVNPVIKEGSGPQQFDSAFEALSANLADLQISEISRSDLFQVQPRLENGKLLFTPVADAYGTTTITVRRIDNPTGPSETLSITILPALRFEAETDFGHLTGHLDGNAWVATTATESESFFAYGPYTPVIDTGLYTAKFRLQSNKAAAANTPVVTIDVWDSHTNQLVAKRTLRGAEFVTPNVYQDFALKFEVASDDALLEFRTYWHDTADVTLDYVRVLEREPVQFEAETDFGHLTGHMDGDGWTATTAGDSASYLAYGPYTTAIDTGLYTAKFRLKTNGPVAPAAPVVTIDVWDSHTNQLVAKRTLRVSQFVTPNVYQDFALEFEVTSDDAVLELRTYWHDTADVKLDRVRVETREPVQLEAETDLGHLTGHADGDHWAATAATESESYLAFGPYTSTIDTGLYTALFRLQTNGAAAGNSPVVTIDVWDSYTNQLVAKRILRGSDFEDSNVDQNFPLKFEVTSDDALLEFRTYWHDTADVKLDYVRVEKREPVQFEAETDLVHLTGHADGEHWAATESESFLAFGPYTTAIDTGYYSALFRLQTNGAAPAATPIVTVDVWDSHANQLVTKRVLRGADFAAANADQDFSLPFQVTGDDAVLEFRTYWHDTADVKLDRVRIVERQPVQFEAETDLAHLTGHVDGDGWAATAAMESESFLAFGPYTTTIDTGHYTAYYRLQSNGVAATNTPVVTIDVWDSHTNQLVAQRILRGSDFTTPYTYRNFSLAFDVTSDDAVLEFRTYWHDTADVKEDYVRILDRLFGMDEDF